MLGAAKPPLHKFSAAVRLRISRRISAAAQKGRIESGRVVLMFDSVLFDLDGTLWDAVPEIAHAWNLALAEKGVDRPPITVEELRPCMGMLLPDIGARLLPELPEAQMLDALDHCCAVENDYLAVHGAAVYPGAAETLAALREHCSLFVVSNCQRGYIEAFFQGTGLGKHFDGFECAGRTGLTKAENIALVAKRYGLKAPVYVGDTALDAASAREAGVPFVHAAYGFGIVENAPAVHSLGELPGLLATMG